MLENKSCLSRRELFEITRRYGAKAALFAAASGVGLSAGGLLGGFAARDARAAQTARYRLRFGGSTINQKNDRYLQTGIYKFIEYVEQGGDGQINIQLIESAGACAEPSCGEKVANSVLDLGTSSSQNLGSVFPYSIALDFPFLWNDRADVQNMFYASDMNKAYRDVWRRQYGIELFYASGEMRSIFMGQKYKDAPDVRTPAQLRGMKVRITNSDMIRAFTASAGMNPIPLAWTETLEGMKSGVVDGMETWPAAASGFGMTRVAAQEVRIDFCPGMVVVFMGARKFERLPDNLKEVFYNAAYRAMQDGYNGVTWAQNAVVGNGPEPAPDSDYAANRFNQVKLTPAELAVFRELGDVRKQAAIFDPIRKRLDELAGIDVHGALKAFADRTKGRPLTPQKWWE
jgi:TRAP-type transport system periplasmic protein